MANNYPRTPSNSVKYFNVEIPDISTSDQRYVVPGFRGKVRRINSVINGAIATSDATLTPKINGTAMTNGAITVAQSGSAAGDVDSSIPSDNHTVTAEDAIEIETDGASTNTVAVVLTVEVEPV